MKKLLIIILLFGILVVGVQSAVDTRNYVYNSTDWIPWLSTPDGKPKVDINLVNISAKNVIVTGNITANTCMCAWNGSVNYPTNKNLDDNITEILTNGTLQKTEGIWTSTNATNFYFAQVDRFTNTNWTTLFEAEIPTCGAGDFVTADGSDLACDTPAGGGGGGGDKWLDNGVWISPNASYASIVNATQFTADLQLNITDGGIKSTTGVSINASDFYDDGVLLTPDTTISNESVKVGLIIDNYIPDNITSANASTIISYTALDKATNVSITSYIDSLDHTDLSDAEILALGYNHTTSLVTYFNTLYTLALGLFNNDNFTTQYYLIDSRYDDSNLTSDYPNLDTDSTDDDAGITKLNMTVLTYTGSLTNGSLLGYAAGNQICNQSFLDNRRLCTEFDITYFIAKYDFSNLNGDAWIIAGSPKYVPATIPVNDCYGFRWGTAGTYLGNYWKFNSTTGGSGNAINCGTSLPLACCG